LLPGREVFERPEFLAAARVTRFQIDLVDLCLDIEALLARGRTNDEIAQELELDGSAQEFKDLVAELRRRREDR